MGGLGWWFLLADNPGHSSVEAFVRVVNPLRPFRQYLIVCWSAGSQSVVCQSAHLGGKIAAAMARFVATISAFAGLCFRSVFHFIYGPVMSVKG